MPNTPPRTWAPRAATRQEIDRCVKAIRTAHPDAMAPGQEPAEVFVTGEGDREAFYVNVQARKDVPVGVVYRTWIVSAGPGGEPMVSWFRSRRGESGDQTLPPSDDSGDTLPP